MKNDVDKRLLRLALHAYSDSYISALCSCILCTNLLYAWNTVYGWLLPKCAEKLIFSSHCSKHLCSVTVALVVQIQKGQN